VKLHVVNYLLLSLLELHFRLRILRSLAERAAYGVTAPACRLGIVSGLIRKAVEVNALAEWLPFKIEK
jgi:hypothetical protein